MDDLNVTLVQTTLQWENPQGNLDMLSRKLKNVSRSTHLVILPEMFTTGFSMQPNSIASTSEIYDWMHCHASDGDHAIYGSVMYREEDKFVNRGIFMRPDGTKKIYDKRHTFTLAGEEKVYSKGDKRITAEYLSWKFNLQICYDLRFPVWSRNTDDYDVLLYVANWPKPRVSAWDALLRARSIENMAYCIGVNRVGDDGNGMPHIGHSQCFDPLGEALVANGWEEEGMFEITLSRKRIQQPRTKLKFLQDRDIFSLK